MIMNREIKFRGKDKDTNKWLAGCLLQDDYGNCCLVGFIDHHETWYDVIPDTIGQFTGLTDKNGEDIYEGDIVKWHRDGRLYLVKFLSGMFYASIEETGKNVHGGFPLHALTENEDEEYKCEVVGNIHDNKELLEE